MSCDRVSGSSKWSAFPIWELGGLCKPEQQDSGIVVSIQTDYLPRCRTRLKSMRRGSIKDDHRQCLTLEI